MLWPPRHAPELNGRSTRANEKATRAATRGRRRARHDAAPRTQGLSAWGDERGFLTRLGRNQAMSGHHLQQPRAIGRPAGIGNSTRIAKELFPDVRRKHDQDARRF